MQLASVASTKLTTPVPAYEVVAPRIKNNRSECYKGLQFIDNEQTRQIEPQYSHGAKLGLASFQRSALYYDLFNTQLLSNHKHTLVVQSQRNTNWRALDAIESQTPHSWRADHSNENIRKNPKHNVNNKYKKYSTQMYPTAYRNNTSSNKVQKWIRVNVAVISGFHCTSFSIAFPLIPHLNSWRCTRTVFLGKGS